MILVPSGTGKVELAGLFVYFLKAMCYTIFRSNSSGCFDINTITHLSHLLTSFLKGGRMSSFRAVFLSPFQGFSQQVARLEAEEIVFKNGQRRLDREFGGPEGEAMHTFKPHLLERLPQEKVLRKRAK